MSSGSLLERVFVLRRTETEEEGTPGRALAISLLALLTAAAAPLLGPDALGGFQGFLWILFLVPCFLLSFYRGWQGATTALVLGMVALTLSEVGSATLFRESVDWWIYGVGSLLLATASVGMGVVTELLQRAEGDPHLADRRWKTGRELRRALDRGDFVLYYQSIVDLHRRRVVAAEALLRWDHPEVGILPPRLFLPSAEETGVVFDLGRWVTETACRDLARWRAHLEDGDDPFRLHVNLSPAQCRDPGALEEIRAVLDRADVPPERLCFRIPAGGLGASETGVRTVRGWGSPVVLGGLGTEETPLESLLRIELDGLVVDPVFTTELGTNDRATTIVAALVRMARAMELEVTAAGVETEAHHRTLREMGCDLGQGFLFGQVLPLDDAVSQARAWDERSRRGEGRPGA